MEVVHLHQWMWVIWLIAAGILAILEINLGTFYLLLAGIASIFAMVAALLHVPIVWQGILFLAATFLFYVYLIPILRKLIPLQKEELKIQTIQSLIGKTGTVVKEIDPASGGLVKIGSETYSAFADSYIRTGRSVQVVDVNVIKLYVREVGTE
jgi:membrane protein implicated in regulation of membrane protease activity